MFPSKSIFPKNFIFCVLASENQELFSERFSLLNGILQGLVKTCKKYFEVNHLLQPRKITFSRMIL